MFGKCQCVINLWSASVLQYILYNSGEMTMFGDIGFVWRKIWLDKFADKYDMKLDYIHSGANKVKMNIFKPMKPESEKWVQEYLNLLED